MKRKEGPSAKEGVFFASWTEQVHAKRRGVRICLRSPRLFAFYASPRSTTARLRRTSRITFTRVKKPRKRPVLACSEWE